MAAYTTIDNPGAHFNTLEWVGTGATLNITGAGFAPAFSWIKTYNQGNQHALFDIVRGATKYLRSNDTAAEATTADTLTSFDSDGFSLGADAAGVGVNYSAADSQISWNWKAGTTTGIDTTGSTITPTSYSFNQDGGFSVIAYTGNDTAGALVPHGLGAVPEVVIVKLISTGAEAWQSYWKPLGNTEFMVLNETAAKQTSTLRWNDTTPTSVLFSLGTETSVNGASKGYIAYCFTPIQGYSKFGTYEGNGNADGPFVYTGFRPKFLMCKSIDSTSSWFMFDNKRLGYNVDNNSIDADTSSAQTTTDMVDLLSTGFKLRSVTSDPNVAETYIYAAFAESPFVNSNGVPTNAR